MNPSLQTSSGIRSVSVYRALPAIVRSNRPDISFLCEGRQEISPRKSAVAAYVYVCARARLVCNNLRDTRVNLCNLICNTRCTKRASHAASEKRKREEETRSHKCCCTRTAETRLYMYVCVCVRATNEIMVKPYGQLFHFACNNYARPAMGKNRERGEGTEEERERNASFPSVRGGAV